MRIKKLAVFDLDRTLLNDDAVISSESEARIHAAMVPGLACTIASGRDMAHIMPYIDQLGWKLVPIIAEQGVIVVTPGPGKCLTEHDGTVYSFLKRVQRIRR